MGWALKTGRQLAEAESSEAVEQGRCIWGPSWTSSSRVTPHCFRRAWATIALNDEKNPTPIDVASEEVLRHKDIATTRRHYAPTKSDRARAALVAMTVR